MKNFIKYVIGVIILYTPPAFAQKRNCDSGPIMTFSFNTKKKPDSVMLWTYPRYNLWDTGIDYTQRPEKDGTFHFNLPKLGSPLYFEIKRVDKGKAGTISEIFLPVYLFNNDSVHVEVFDGARPGQNLAIFSGRGSAKFNLTQLLDKINQASFHLVDTYSTSALSKVIDSTSLINALTGYDVLLKAIKNRDITIINEYRHGKYNGFDSLSSKLEPDAEQLILLSRGNFESHWKSLPDKYFKVLKNDPKLCRILFEFVNKKIDEAMPVSSELSAISPVHYNVLTYLLKTKAKINNKEYSVDVTEFYNQIKNYSDVPKVKDLLLQNFFMNKKLLQGVKNMTAERFDSLLMDASKYLVSEAGKEVVRSKLLFKNGEKLFDGNFTDLLGNKLNTKSLLGKVFLLEVWALGCGGCVSFHEKFEKEMWPVLKDNKDFVVLSIFDGKDLASWKSGIDSKLYTSLDYLNVSTIPARMSNHPFFKYYQVNYAPFMLLVDANGRIIQNVQGYIKSEDLIKMVSDGTNMIKKITKKNDAIEYK